MIKIKNLSKIYEMGEEKIHALDNISLNIERGEYVSVVGASGSGKTTLMNIIGLLDVADSGDYSLNDINIKEMTDNELAKIRNQNIGFIFQSFNLLPKLTALENVQVPLMYKGVSNKKSKELAYKALEKVGLIGREKHLPSQLSGGQQQRVAIARALICNPSIILADEPTGALDSKTGIEIVEMLGELNRNGQTIILITHDAKIAEIAKRKISMSDGKIFEQNATSEKKEAGK